MSRNSHTPHIRSLPDYPDLPRPVVARIETLPPGSLAPWHRHPWWQLSWAISGVVNLQTRHASYMAPPQRAVLIPPGVEHQAWNASHTEMRSLYVANALMGWAADDRCKVLEISPLVRELIVAIAALGTDFVVEGANERLIAVLIDRLAGLPEVAFDLPMPEDSRLMRICERLQASPDDARTMADWGRLAGVSERTLARLFLRQTGMSFGEWRQRLRLLLALTALERGEKVTVAALEAGYASASAFIAAFRRSFGVTPSAMFRPEETAGR